MMQSSSRTISAPLVGVSPRIMATSVHGQRWPRGGLAPVSGSADRHARSHIVCSSTPAQPTQPALGWTVTVYSISTLPPSTSFDASSQASSNCVRRARALRTEPPEKRRRAAIAGSTFRGRRERLPRSRRRCCSAIVIMRRHSATAAVHRRVFRVLQRRRRSPVAASCVPIKTDARRAGRWLPLRAENARSPTSLNTNTSPRPAVDAKRQSGDWSTAGTPRPRSRVGSNAHASRASASPSCVSAGVSVGDRGAFELATRRARRAGKNFDASSAAHAACRRGGPPGIRPRRPSVVGAPCRRTPRKAARPRLRSRAGASRARAQEGSRGDVEGVPPRVCRGRRTHRLRATAAREEGSSAVIAAS